MSIGSVLIGIGLTLVVAAYLARPFRAAGGNQKRGIEAWVAQVRAEGASPRHTAPPAGAGADADADADADEVNFCPQCGRRASPDDYFCAKCGHRLRAGEAGEK